MSDWINIFWYIFEYQWYFHSFKLTVVSKHTQWMFIPHMPSEASVWQFWSGCQYTEGQPEPEGETGTGCVATGEEGSSSSPGPEIIRTTQCLVQCLTYLIYNIFISYFTASKLPAFQKYRYQFTMKCEYLIIYITYCQDKTWLTATENRVWRSLHKWHLVWEHQHLFPVVSHPLVKGSGRSFLLTFCKSSGKATHVLETMATLYLKPPIKI